ncbi:hypothetical protein BV25DRAFT_1917714 [Artomyces pyxidatus]|uniref:Uncharacterized protein n=1 Tax=Artomyces pyxidatus TaxID=48021 RepID=A0ACB8SVX9_9AGAM|nr:hypothetical protein BV25DRAFT_1917714 [Artomyces pyxidatus]
MQHPSSSTSDTFSAAYPNLNDETSNNFFNGVMPSNTPSYNNPTQSHFYTHGMERSNYPLLHPRTTLSTSDVAAQNYYPSTRNLTSISPSSSVADRDELYQVGLLDHPGYGANPIHGSNYPLSSGNLFPAPSAAVPRSFAPQTNIAGPSSAGYAYTAADHLMASGSIPRDVQPTPLQMRTSTPRPQTAFLNRKHDSETSAANFPGALHGAMSTSSTLGSGRPGIPVLSQGASNRSTAGSGIGLNMLYGRRWDDLSTHQPRTVNMSSPRSKNKRGPDVRYSNENQALENVVSAQLALSNTSIGKRNDRQYHPYTMKTISSTDSTDLQVSRADIPPLAESPKKKKKYISVRTLEQREKAKNKQKRSRLGLRSWFTHLEEELPESYRSRCRSDHTRLEQTIAYIRDSKARIAQLVDRNGELE